MGYQGETTLNIALIHHPVMNKKHEVIGSAVTNLDIHDIARTARTYGVAQYFITTPYEDQKTLVSELLEHWLTGYGAAYNPARREALKLVALENSLEDVINRLNAKYGKRPMLVATTGDDSTGYKDIKTLVRGGEPVLLLFGTAHGLAPEVMNSVDGCLPPVKGETDYNHLSVRSAASIIIDRILGS
jgi:hypothetical protein